MEQIQNYGSVIIDLDGAVNGNTTVTNTATYDQAFLGEPFSEAKGKWRAKRKAKKLKKIADRQEVKQARKGGRQEARLKRRKTRKEARNEMRNQQQEARMGRRNKRAEEKESRNAVEESEDAETEETRRGAQSVQAGPETLRQFRVFGRCSAEAGFDR